MTQEHEERFDRIEATLEKLVEVQSAQGRNLETLTAVMSNLAVAQARTERHMDELSVKSTETQGKLDALIDMWDRMIRERGGKNGKTGTEPPPAE